MTARSPCAASVVSARCYHACMVRVVLALVLALAAIATAAAQPTSCAPTKPDMLGPFYKPGAPERAATGQGLVGSGIVRSAKGCAPLRGAQPEWWSADGRGEYHDARAARGGRGGGGAGRAVQGPAMFLVTPRPAPRGRAATGAGPA